MSGGASGLEGYVYQQRYLTFRVLASIAGGVLQGYGTGLPIAEFAVEGRGSAAGPIWDVRFGLTDRSVHLRECKDTEISREDRLTFYWRVRKELGSGTPADQLTVGWVVDPEKQATKILEHFSGMVPLCQDPTLAVPQKCPGAVTSSATALDEAMYCLCGGPTDKTPAPAIDEAKALLGRLALDRHRLADLEQSVQLLATGTFTTGTGEAIAKFITGELTTKICETGEAAYTVAAFIQTVQAGTVALQASGTLKKLLTFNSAQGYRSTVQGVEWRRLPGQPTKEWPLAERLPGLAAASGMIVAPVGLGKTVTSQQCFAEEATRRDPHHVLRVEPSLLSPEEVEGFLTLLCILCGLAPTWVGLDGLDEVRLDRREEWMALIDRLRRIPDLTLVLTARQEVVAAHPWLLRISASLAPRELQPLTTEQVKGEFERVGLPVPGNTSLLRALRNPLLLSLYASVVTPGDMPLTESGQVTAFQVIKEFWRRTVAATSIGHRAVPDEGLSQHRKRVAVGAMVDRTVRGELALALGGCTAEVAAGTEMLVREGVLVRQGTHAVQWVHEWVREYALVDYLFAGVGSPGVRPLVNAVATVTVDHVARSAAVGGVKWVIAHPEWGTAQDYLVELWARHPGHASDVLAVLVEGDANLLSLAALPVPLLIEAVLQARLLQAGQWRGQIATLPLDLFTAADGERLQDVVTEYEVEIDS